MEQVKNWYTNQNTIRYQQSKIRSEVKCNFNLLNQFLTLFLTITTSEEYKTTNIKEFRRTINEYFKSLSEKLKIISIVTCNECGYLYCNCLLFVENKFNFDISVLKRKWQYGDVYIQYLNQNDINSIANCFADNYKEIRTLKDMSDKELKFKADDFFKKYIKNLSISDCLNALDKKAEMLEECYENFCELREQQQDGQRNKLFQLIEIL